MKSLKELLGSEEARRPRSEAVDRSAISERMKNQWADAQTRREETERRLAVMSDKALLAEVRRHQQAKWRPSALLEHVKKHQRQYAAYAGHPVSPTEIGEISRLTLTSWDRLFRSIEPDGATTYAFLARWQASDVLLTVTRSGRIRTMMPIDNLKAFLARHPELVEVTDRARRLEF